MLFLDELPEFERASLEALRQPLEDGCVSISRANARVSYPARFVLVAAMNPCPCGNFGSPDNNCRCTTQQIRRYLSKISGPLLDRIDLHIEVARVRYEELTDKSPAEPSSVIAERVEAARRLQRERYKGTGVFCNAQLTGSLFNKYCTLDAAGDALMRRAFAAMGFTARSFKRVLMVARTIADLAGESTISAAHVAEAIQYRALDRKYWGDGR